MKRETKCNYWMHLQTSKNNHQLIYKWFHPLLKNFYLKKKKIMLMGNFDKSFIFWCRQKTPNFINNIYCNSFFPTINKPNLIAASSKTLIDSIFSNDIWEKMKAQKITTSIFYHFTWFLAIPSKKAPFYSQYYEIIILNILA